jgi:hypothetical protein
MFQTLKAARKYYEDANQLKQAGSRHVRSPYVALNSLWIDAAVSPFAERQERVLEAQRAGQEAQAGYATSCNFWDAIMPAEAMLVEHLLRRKEDQEIPNSAFQSILASYRSALVGAYVNPRQFDSVERTILNTALYLEARALGLELEPDEREDAPSRVSALRKTAAQLRTLIANLG